MSEQYDLSIEHPNQATWFARYGTRMSDAQNDSLADRYVDEPQMRDHLDSLSAAVERATIINYAHRDLHESGNRTLLNVGPKLGDLGDRQLRADYDAFAGKPAQVAKFIEWFSSVSHQAYLNQEKLDPKDRFTHVSLELGGTRQFGDWEVTKPLDRMARSIPAGILAIVPDAKVTVYGQRTCDRAQHPQIEYAESVPKSYGLLPRYELPHADETQMQAAAFVDHDLDTDAPIVFDYTVIRRRRAVADIYIPDQSDVVIFKESIGLMVMRMMDTNVRDALVDDCRRVFEEARSTRDLKAVGAVKLDNTPGARLAGQLFEEAIRSRVGTTRDIIPISAHYVQAVGEKYAALRQATH